ncbi:MAG: AraC family transcriptional regulator [Clostridia bacterium]|nr:AraC family transcriptional regulator [Clostridia bacterium]
MTDLPKEQYERITYEKPGYRFSVALDKIWGYGHSDRSGQFFHEDLEIKYYTEGTSTLLINNVPYPVRAGDVVIVNPYDIHATIPLNGERAVYHLYMLSPDFFGERNNAAPDLRRELLDQGLSFTHVIHGDSVLCDLLSQINEEYKNPDTYSDMMTKSLLSAFFIRLLRCYTTEDSAFVRRRDLSRYGNQISEALRVIHTDYARSFTVEDLSKMCGMSKYWFCHIFKEMTGRSPIEYINWYRVKVADALLDSSGCSISEAAAATGFSTASYFCRCYKKYNGHSASERKRSTN